MSAKKQLWQEKELGKAMAFEIASSYCVKNNLSVKKLKDQRFEWIYDSAFFAQPSDVIPDGLRNDRETQPKPTLIITLVNGEIVIKETEYTRKYLAQ